MKLTTKLLAMLLALMMLLTATVLTSCNSGDSSDEQTTPADTTISDVIDGDDVTTADPGAASTPDANDIVIIKDGAYEAKVIRSDLASADSAQVLCAADIRIAIEDATGIAPKIDTDWVKTGQDHNHDTFEVLVGYTEYSESRAVYAELSYGEYMVKVVGNKLVVAGYTDDAITTAGEKLMSLIKSSATDGNLTIPADTLITGVVDKMMNDIPGFENGTYSSTYECGGDATLLIVKDTDIDSYNKYLTKLEGEGWTQYTTNSINNNSFATYTTEKYTMNLGFYDYEDSVRIIVEPLAKPVGLKADNVYEKITTTQITMLGLEAKTNGQGNGLSMLVRLADGSFIVIDGGFSNSASNANLLITQLKEQSKDYIKAGEKITIAAWIITHAHGDHSGMIVTQYGMFKKDFNVEKFLVNFLSETERQRAIELDPEDRWSNGEGSQAAKVVTTARALGAEMQYVHVGQVLYFADVKLDILYTIESFAPKLCNAFNTCSLTIKFTFDSGDTFLMTGDTTGNGMQVAAKMFGNYLQCDMLQVAHHGYSTHGNDSGMIYAYGFVDPATLLWPQGASSHPNYTSKSYNKVLFSTDKGGTNPNYKETLLAGMVGDTIICPIPYTVGQAIVIRSE